MSAALSKRATGPQQARGWRILVVEDDPNCRWVLCALLQRMGYHCQVACNGREALERVKSFAPQAIVMDLVMPEIDGLEATRRLKADARTRGIPIVALTGHATSQYESAARRAGVADFLPKPVLFQDLLERLQRLLDG
jgi:CheY-like chemotaxis protein